MPSVAERRREERTFFSGMSFLMASAVVVGFLPTLYARPLFPARQAAVPPEPFFLLHGAVCTLWLALMVIQPWLIGRGRYATHRRLGFASLSVGAMVAGTAIWGGITAANRSTGFMEAPMAPEAFLLIPFLDAVFFALLLLAGVWFRRDPSSHKRMMLFASLSMCQPGFVRIRLIGVISGALMQFFLTFVFVTVVARWDQRTLGAVHWTTRWLGFPLFLSQFLRFPVAATEAWQVVGRWMLSLAR